MKKIACLGEFLLRMSPEMPGTWIQQSSIPVFLGGAEFNVAAALQNWGNPVKYISALPDNSVAEDVLTEIKRMGMDTSAIQRTGERIGVYILPQGADLKNAGVIYDRAGSSYASLQSGKLPWKELLKDCAILHFSAISPGLSAQTAELCMEAVEAAAELGLLISVDLNYRNKLWKYGVSPAAIMPSLVKHCHIVMGNIWSAHELLDSPLNERIHEKKSTSAYLEQAGITAAYIRKIAPACKWVANTFRFDQPDGIHYYAALDTESGQYVSPELYASSIVDRIGSGDCFMAGLLHGWAHAENPDKVVKLAAVAAVGKLREKGDFTKQSIESIYKKMQAHV
jgi:2-dehydro-3-deoxygluconokinase